MFVTECPRCHEKVELEDHRHGRAVRCPQCDAAFRAPPPDEPGRPEWPQSKQADSPWGDTVATLGTLIAVLGLLATLGGIWLHRAGQPLPLDLAALAWLIALPVFVVLASWIAAARCRRRGLILACRMTGYLWLMAMIYLAVQMVRTG